MFSSLVLDIVYRGLIIVIVYYFQIWNKNYYKIIIIRVINSHMGPVFTETPTDCL